jgi:hypothetical protein
VEFQRLNYNQQPLTNITTPSGRTVTIDVDSRTLILQPKDALQDLEGIPAAQRKILFGPAEDYCVPKKDGNDTETGVSMVPSPTSTGVIANVPAKIEHFVHTISIFVVLLRISFFIIGCVMDANAIHSTIANVPEGLLLIGLTLTAKLLETIGFTSCICSEMSTLTQNNFMNGTATSTCTNVMLCVLLFPHHVCKQ